jgi:hypothetical protein
MALKRIPKSRVRDALEGGAPNNGVVTRLAIPDVDVVNADY